MTATKIGIGTITNIVPEALRKNSKSTSALRVGWVSVAAALFGLHHDPGVVMIRPGKKEWEHLEDCWHGWLSVFRV